MTEFIKRKVLNDDINEHKNDINNDIIDILKEQLKTKDMQISNLQQIIYNRDTKLIETSNKKWWKFWKWYKFITLFFQYILYLCDKINNI